MPHSSIFKSPDFLLFRQVLQNYNKKTTTTDFSLSDQELMQLSWHLQGGNVTPEARTSNLQGALHFEIQRSLSRLYSLELLRRGDEKSYQEFIQDQNKACPLSLEAFQSLSTEARLLSPDNYAVVRASCFLTISDTAKRIFSANRLNLSTDSEEFLSDFAKIAAQYHLLMPITSQMTPLQLKLLQKVYWPNMHFRHMLYTEGGNNMTKTFKEGIDHGKFSADDFLIWKWRWLTNMFGFQGGKAAKYYDQTVHNLTCEVFHSLEASSRHNKNFLDTYLQRRALLAGLDQKFLGGREQEFLSHMLCYFHQTKCTQKNLGRDVLIGYQAFQVEQGGQSDLADLYADYRKDDTLLTPTYVPAVANNVYYLLNSYYSMSEEQSIQQAVQFTCQVLQHLYRLPPEKRISCFSIAKEEALKPILTSWLLDHNSLQFQLRENQLTIQIDPEPKSSIRMRL